MGKDHATSNREAARFIDGTRTVATKARQLGFQNSDARERWPSAAARDQHSS
jgi:hypothetical protein